MKNYIIRFGVLCFTLIFAVSTVCSAANVQNEAENSSEVIYIESVDRNEAILLSTLGIHKNFSYPEENITRLQFAEAMLKMINVSAYIDSNVTFADMADSEEIKIAQTAITYGIFEKPESGYFRPYENITVSDAALVCLDILGYREAGKLYGSTNRYTDITTATNIGLLDNVSSPLESPLNLRQMSHIIYNALHTDMMMQTGFGDEVSFEIIEGENILNRFHDLTWSTGRIVANEITGLVGTAEVQEGFCSIDGTLYKTGTSLANEYLGYTVDYYYDNSKSLVCALPTDDNTLITIDSDDLVSGSNFQKITWSDDNLGKNKSISVSPYVDVIYNNAADFGAKAEDLFVPMGILEFLDYNGDNKYDVIFIHEFETVIAESISEERYVIGDKLTDKAVLLDSDKFDTVSYIIKSADSAEADFSYENIDAGNVLLIEKDRSGKNITVYVSDTKINGIIDEISSSDSSVFIDGSKFFLNYTFHTEINSGNKKAESFAPGFGGTFYLDSFGRIAYFESEEEEVKYGFFSKASSPKGLNTDTQIRIFAHDNTWKNISLASKTEINGKRVKEEEAAALLPQTPQLIKYSVNLRNELTSLETFSDRSQESDYQGYDTEAFTKDASITASARKNSMSFEKKYFIGTGVTPTMIFNVPDSAIQNGKLDEDKINVYSASVFRDAKKYTVEIYDADEFKVAGVLIWKDDPDTLETNFEQRLMFVNKCVNALDENGDEVVKLTGYFCGNLRNFNCTDTQIAKEVRKGDILRIKLLPDGTIRQIERIMSLSAPDSAAYSPETNGAYSLTGGTATGNTESALYVGDVYKIDYSTGRFTAFTDSAASPTAFNSNGVSLLRYDSKTEEFSTASISDSLGSASGINPSDRVIVYERYAYSYDMVVID